MFLNQHPNGCVNGLGKGCFSLPSQLGYTCEEKAAAKGWGMLQLRDPTNDATPGRVVVVKTVDDD